MLHCLDTLWVENFAEIALSRMVKEIEANLCFSIFGKRWKKFQMATIFGESKIFGKSPKLHCLDTPWVENFNEIAPSRTVKEIEANLCFSILAKIRKFKMAAIFRERNYFFKLPRVHFLYILWVENFDKIALSRTVKEIEANLCFAIFGKVAK